MAKGVYRKIKDTDIVSICYASEKNVGKYRCNHTLEQINDNCIKKSKTIIDYKHHQNEITIAKSFKPGEKIILNGREKIIIDSGIPIGFPKTDVLIKLKDAKTGRKSYLPISVKLPNAKYAHNHLNDKIANKTLGPKYKDILSSMIRSNKEKLLDVKPKEKINKYNENRTYLSVPIGYEVQVALNKSNNDISEEIKDIDTKTKFLSSATTQKNVDVEWIYSRKITNEKNKGVAKYILITDSVNGNYSAQDHINKMQTIKQYAKDNPIYINFRKRNMDVYHNSIDLPEDKKKNLKKINSRLYFYIHNVNTIIDFYPGENNNLDYNIKNKLSNSTNDILNKYQSVLFSDIKKANVNK